MTNTDIRHTQTLRQEQTMSARQLQSLSLLHTPRQELRQVVEQMLAENPVLEITSPPAEIPAGDPLSQPDPDDDDYTHETSGDDDDWVNRVISDADDWLFKTQAFRSLSTSCLPKGIRIPSPMAPPHQYSFGRQEICSFMGKPLSMLILFLFLLHTVHIKDP